MWRLYPKKWCHKCQNSSGTWFAIMDKFNEACVWSSISFKVFTQVMHIPILLNLMNINLLIVWTTTWVTDARTIDGGRTDRRTDEQDGSNIRPTSSQSQLRCGGIIRIEPCTWSHKSLYILRSIISALIWSAYTLNIICYMFPNIAWIGDILSALGKVQTKDCLNAAWFILHVACYLL